MATGTSINDLFIALKLTKGLQFLQKRPYIFSRDIKLFFAYFWKATSLSKSEGRERSIKSTLFGTEEVAELI